jgi:hypothetical protein
MDAELLANLYVQLKRLHGSLRLSDVICAIHETLTNLIGTEDFALLLHDHASGRWEPLCAVGAGAQVTGFAAGGEPEGAVSVVALKSGLGPRPVGMIVLMRLVTHKPALTGRDRALLEEYAQQAGVALEAALCAELAGVPRVDVAALRARVAFTVVPVALTEGSGS